MNTPLKPPFSQLTQVRRFEGPRVENFEYINDSHRDFTIFATIQPLSAEALVALNDGLRSRALYACFTYEELITAQAGGAFPDLVFYHGAWLETHGGFDDHAPFLGKEYILARPEV